jgi:uncharacterized metal-binding protein
MPNASTHDAITLVLAVPAAAAAYSATHSFSSSAIVAASFVFGGLMFGPDLDTQSRQYSRWYFLRSLWYPYQRFFSHRSRFSHGLIFGALIRVIYFLGALTLVGFALAYGWASYAGGKLPEVTEFARLWQTFGSFARTYFGEHVFLLVFVGLWFGAASHTFTDMAGSFVKTGRVLKFL